MSRASALESLRSREVLHAARELFAAHPSGEVLVVIAPGVEVPEAIRATAPAGEHRVAVLPLSVALEVTRARSADAARDLADPPPLAAVRVLYLDAHRAVVVASAPSHIVGHVDPYDTTRGAA